MPPNSSGFTLVEILVSVVILALLGILAIPNFKAFNESQTLNNATQDLATALRTAQANAQLGTSCPISGRAATNWSVYILNATSGFQVQATCPPPPTNIEVKSNIQLPQAISISSPGGSCGNFPITLGFSLNSPSVACNLVVTDSNLGSNNTKTIVINQGGAINVQ